MQIKISVTSDFICPWCYIGERHLALALKSLPDDVSVSVRWLPFELNPDMPAEGADRKAYRSKKFGSWERSQAMDAGTVRAGQASGAVFNYEAMVRTPNTLAAHRLSWLAEREGKQSAFVEAALRGYFAVGRDVGSHEVLADIAGEIGMDRTAVLAFLASDEAIVQVRALEEGAAGQGVRGVPHFDIAGQGLSGAQPPEVIRAALLKALGLTLPSSAA